MFLIKADVNSVLDTLLLDYFSLGIKKSIVSIDLPLSLQEEKRMSLKPSVSYSQLRCEKAYEVSALGKNCPSLPA